jgi:hypothetical protein
VAHQLVDHPSGNASIFQPGREGVAQVGQLAEPQSCSQKGEDVIPPEQGNADEQSAGFFGG